MTSTHLRDAYGRTFPYLRLSVTDVCNFKCSYCLPNGYQKQGRPMFLTRDELVRVARVFAALGTWKIRLTGGEPTVRKDFLDIASGIANVEGISRLAMTTNGYKLPERAAAFRAAGLSAINISIDSISREGFHRITGVDRLDDVLKGIDACLEAGFESVKLNTVLLQGLNDQDLTTLIRFVADKPVSLRFIELMQTGDNADYFKKHHLPAARVRDHLLAEGWLSQPRKEGAGPAEEFRHAASQGSIGLIAPYSKDFCKGCNRLRVSAKGKLHLCLFGEAGFPLRDLLQSDDQLEDLTARLSRLLAKKQESHFLHHGMTGATPHLASLGG